MNNNQTIKSKTANVKDDDLTVRALRLISSTLEDSEFGIYWGLIQQSIRIIQNQKQEIRELKQEIKSLKKR